MLGMTEYAILEIARVSIELTSPLSIGSGEADLLDDAPIVRDSQNLPVIPATSLMGVLRSLWRRKHPDRVDTLFGFQEKDQAARSMISASSGVIHGQDNRPVAPLSDLSQDTLLQSAAYELVTRDHVRLNSRGVVDGRGKFDRTSIPKGHRFTFELSLRRSDDLEIEGPREGDLKELLSTLASSSCRLGSKTTSGLGDFKVIKCLYGCFDLRKSDDFERYLNLPTALHEQSPLSEFKVSLDHELYEVRLSLKPEEAWLQGGGDETRYADDQGQGPKIVPYREADVKWGDKGGLITNYEKRDYLMTGTSVRGALRHRAAFHMRRLLNHWSEGNLCARDKTSAAGGDIDPYEPATLTGLNILFGEIKELEGGRRGLLLTSDAHLSAQRVALQYSDHLSIDRFSGAPVQGHLFSEVALSAQKEMRLDIPLALSAPYPGTLSSDEEACLEVACYALSLSLRDLCKGRLQLGAGAGRGYGYFSTQEGTTPSWRGLDDAQGGRWRRALSGERPQREILEIAARCNMANKPSKDTWRFRF